MRFKRLIEFRETLMVDLLHDFDFSLYTFSTIRLQEFELLVNFNCDLLIENFVQTNSDDSICTLSDSFTYNVIVNVFDVASIGTELVLLIYTVLVVVATVIFVFFDLVCHRMGLRDVSLVMLLLLDVLLNVLLASTQFFGSLRTRLTVLARRNSVSGSDDPPGLSRLEMSILVLQVCCILNGVIICSETAWSYSVPEPRHVVGNDVVLIWLQLAVLINV